MSKAFSTTMIIAATAVVLMLGLMLTIQIGSVAWLATREAPELPEPADYSWIASSRFDDYIDEQIDAGIVDVTPIRDDAMLDQRKILISHGINSRTARDAVSKLFYLNSQDPKAPIDLYITTQGGYTDSLFSIVDAIRHIDAPVNTYAIGGCHSAGAAILSSGTGTRYATSNALIMIHTNFIESSEEYNYNELDRQRFERLWKDTSNLPEDWYPMTDDGTYYINAQEALDLGVIDEVIEFALEEDN